VGGIFTVPAGDADCADVEIGAINTMSAISIKDQRFIIRLQVVMRIGTAQEYQRKALGL
jgi:hypothetical protein